MKEVCSFLNKRYVLLFLFSSTLFFGVKAQVPIAYYDFEDNNNRNTTVESTVQESVSTIGSPVISVSSLTASHGAGNGTFANYGGSNAGYSIGYYGFTTNVTSLATNPSIKFGPFNCTGFSTLTLSMDILGVGVQMPTNVDVYYSLNDIVYTRIVVATTVNSSYATRTFTIPAAANGAASLYLKVIGFGAGASPTSTDGVMQIDNFSLNSSLITASTTLIDAAAQGTGLSSGGSYVPAYTSLTVNGGGITVSASGNLTFGTVAGTTGLILTNGVFDVQNTTLTFQTSNTPLARTTGTLTIGSAGSLVFGTAGNLGGNAFTIPNNVFTSAPLLLSNLTVNRTNSLTLGNQSLTIDGGTLTLTAGVFSLGANTLTIQNSNTPLSRTSGTLTVAATSNISFGSAGNTGGLAFAIPNGFFTASPPVLNSFTVNRTNSLTLGNQGLTLNGTLTLESGVLDVVSNALVFQTGATPIAVTSGSLTAGSGTNITFGANAAGFTIPNNTFTSAPTINSLTINRAGGVTIGNQAFTLNGTLTLTAGVFDVQNTTLTFQTSNTPLARTTGTLTIGSAGSLVFGTAGIAGTATLPNTLFTVNPVTIVGLTVDRGLGNTLNLGNNPIILTGDLNVSSGTFAINNATGTLTVQGDANVSSGTLSVTIALGSVVVQGNLNLTAGNITTTVANAAVTVQGNITGTGSQTQASIGKISMTGSGKTLSSGVTYDNVEINSAGNISLTGTTTFTGVITLTAGNLLVGSSNTLILTTDATQIVKTAGFITMDPTSSLTIR
jgi:hypothetical protein